MAEFVITNLVITDEVISSGQHGKVYLGVDKKANKEYAVKIVNKKGVHEIILKGVRNEIRLLKELNHTNIIKCYYSCENDDAFMIVMEKYAGDLTSYHNMSTMDAKIIFKKLVSAIHYLHIEKQIIHGDVKFENILFNNNNHDIVLADFGLSYGRWVFKHEYINDTRGTPLYHSPALRMRRYHKGFPNDIYALGIVLYLMVIDYDMSSIERFKNSQMSLQSYLFILEKERLDKIKTLTDLDLKDLLLGMLAHSELDRFDINMVITHPWLNM